MTSSYIYKNINAALDKAPRNAYVAEFHLQVIKYAELLEGVSGKEFCEGLGVKPSWGVEFAKMKKIASRLREADLNPDKI
jgi:hypothetical protein